MPSKAELAKYTELAKVVDESGMTPEELIAEIRAVQSGTFSKVRTHEKYGLQIELFSRTHKPYSMSVNKARTATLLAADIAKFVKDATKPETKLVK